MAGRRTARFSNPTPPSYIHPLSPPTLPRSLPLGQDDAWGAAFRQRDHSLRRTECRAAEGESRVDKSSDEGTPLLPPPPPPPPPPPSLRVTPSLRRFATQGLLPVWWCYSWLQDTLKRKLVDFAWNRRFFYFTRRVLAFFRVNPAKSFNRPDFFYPERLF